MSQKLDRMVLLEAVHPGFIVRTPGQEGVFFGTASAFSTTGEAFDCVKEKLTYLARSDPKISRAYPQHGGPRDFESGRSWIIEACAPGFVVITLSDVAGHRGVNSAFSTLDEVFAFILKALFPELIAQKEGCADGP